MFANAGVRMDMLREQNADPDWRLDGGSQLNGQPPFIGVGYTWR